MAVDIDIVSAAARLREGELVAFPTETVYGLGADAMNAQAVAKIFAMKGRPADHPLIVHIERADDLAHFAADIPNAAWLLASRFWPGPLTMILRRMPAVPVEVTGGQETVGVRVPSHPVAQSLLREFNAITARRGGIAAPSANRFGHVSPTTAQHVRDEFGPGLPVLDGGDCPVGLESTIVDLSRGGPVLLRPGGIARTDLERALQMAVKSRDADAPRASGTLAAHYAPRTAVTLAESADLERHLGQSTAVLALRPEPPQAKCVQWITAPADAAAYGHDLYASLRRLDASGARRILVESPPRTPPWEAINDRLARAAAGAAMFDDEP